MLVQIANQGAVGNLEIFVLFKPTSQFCDRPVSLVRERRFVGNWEDHLSNGLLRNRPGAACYGSISQTINPAIVEPRDPQFEGPLAHPRVLLRDLEASTTQQKVNRTQASSLSFIVRAVAGDFQLFNGCVLRIGKLSFPADSTY